VGDTHAAKGSQATHLHQRQLVLHGCCLHCSLHRRMVGQQHGV
jgi:hypothetical protein